MKKIYKILLELVLIGGVATTSAVVTNKVIMEEKMENTDSSTIIQTSDNEENTTNDEKAKSKIEETPENVVSNTIEEINVEPKQSPAHSSTPVQSSNGKKAEDSGKASTDTANQSGVHVMTDEEKLNHQKKMEAYFNEKHATDDLQEQAEIFKKYFGDE